MSRLHNERGQAVVLGAVMLASLLGMAAMVVDVGSWFRAKRAMQAEADAAALAGAQALPDDPATARSLALQYAASNGNDVTSADITFESQVVANDTIVVHAHENEPSFFARIFGLGSADVGASAKARAENPGQAQYVVPVAVNFRHPQIRNYGVPTQLDLVDLHNPGSGNAAGSFGLIDLIQTDNGSVGSGTLADWVTNGLTQSMPLGNYYAVPSSKFNDSQFDGALNARLGSELLFPVYDTLNGTGSNAIFHILGWVGFIPTSFDPSGKGSIYGSFTRFIAQGLQSTDPSQPSFGSTVIQLVG